MTGKRQHYCSYCLRYIEPDADLCPRLSCGKARPSADWPYFFEAGENIDGRFRIRNRLGAGGAGVTYRAIDLAADQPEHRDVAIKILHLDRGQGMLQDRLRLEGEVLRRLDHPNVVAFRELKVDGEEPYYLATEFVPGGGLDELLRRHGRLAARTVLQVGAQIARALAAAHAIGVTHRDLKPSNILVYDTEEFPIRVRVADWGIARAQPEFVPRRHVTIQGGFVGTPEFASPEQLRGEATVGPPTDIFGLGVLMHTLAGGQPVRDLVARGAVDFQALRSGATRYERVPLSAGERYEAHLPLLDELVDQLITRSPEARPDAESVAAYCEELLEAGDSAPKAGQAMPPLPALVPAAAFESDGLKQEDMLLPPGSEKVMPLRLSDPTGEEPPPPNTLEMEDPASIVEQPPSAGGEVVSSEGSPVTGGPVEVPWPKEEAEGVSAPTAVPEEMVSIAGVDVLQESAAPREAPAQIAEFEEPAVTPPPVEEPRVAPIAERDDEPFPVQKSRAGLWVAAVLLLAGGSALVFASPGLRTGLGDRLDNLLGGGDPAEDGASGTSPPVVDIVESGEGSLEAAEVAERETPTPAPAPDREPPTRGEAGGAGDPTALAEADDPVEVPTPSPGVVIDHGFEDSRGRVGVDSGREGTLSSVFFRRPGAPRMWEPEFEAHGFHEYQSRPSPPRFVEETIPPSGSVVLEEPLEPDPTPAPNTGGGARPIDDAPPHGKFKETTTPAADDEEQPTFSRPTSKPGKHASEEDEEQPTFSRPVTRPKKS